MSAENYHRNHQNKEPLECLCPKCSARIFATKQEATCPICGEIFQTAVAVHPREYFGILEGEEPGSVMVKEKPTIRRTLKDAWNWLKNHDKLALVVAFVCAVVILGIIAKANGQAISVMFSLGGH